MKILFFIPILFIAFSCSNQKQNDFSNDKTITDIFSKTEISDLLKIQHFFDKNIGLDKANKQKKLDEVYSKFFLKNSKIDQQEDLKLSIRFDNQKELYTQLDKKTFNDIWKVSSKSKRLSLNPKGKYASLLKEVGKKDSVINNYYNGLQRVGDISPSIVSDLLKNYKNYNIKNPKVRLMIAIHYLTLNDQFDTK